MYNVYDIIYSVIIYTTAYDTISIIKLYTSGYYDTIYLKPPHLGEMPSFIQKKKNGKINTFLLLKDI